MSKNVILHFVFTALLLLSCEHNPVAPLSQIGPIIFATKSGDYTQIYAINEDGSGLIKLTRSSFSNFSPRWSRDGDRIVFNSIDRTPNHHLHSIVITEEHGSNERGVLEHGYGPVFSPDGNRIAFGYDTDFPGWGGKRDVVIYDLKSQVASWILSDSTDYFISDWSPDGSYLLVTAHEDLTSQGQSKVCLMNLLDSSRVELVKGGEFGSGRFSPDGQSITYVSRERLIAPSFRDTLFTIQINGSNKSHIVTLENAIISAPVWSPDGFHIAFLAWNTSATIDKNSIYIINSDGTGLRQLFTHQQLYNVNSLDWRW